MSSDKKGSASAAGWTVAIAAVAFGLIQMMSELLGLFDLRLSIKILVIATAGLAALAFQLRDMEPGVASRAVWALCGMAALGAVGIGVIGGFVIPSLDEQIADVRRDASREGKRVYEFPAAHFHGGKSESRLFYIEESDRYKRVYRSPSPLASGEIRIYDVHDGDLTEAFRFQPEDGKTAVFRYRFLGDLDHDGDEELIGGYGCPQDQSEALLPFAVYWDDPAARYRIASLQNEWPDGQLMAQPRPSAQAFRGGYREPVSFRDESEDLSISGYRVQDFAVTKNGLMINGLAVDARTPSRIGEVELAVNQIRLSDNAPVVVPCKLRTERALLAPWPSDRPLHRVLADRWEREEPFCQPIFSSS
jgi:hypothetical protein